MGKCWAAVVVAAAAACSQPAHVPPPTPHPKAERPTMIVTGHDHSCALVRGDVWCWGSNMHGQLGDASFEDAVVPRRVAGLVETVALALGDSHTCALDARGHVACWGADGEAQLGTVGALEGRSSAADTALPVAVALPTTAHHIAAAGDFTCALLDDDRVACWGHAGYGELGGATDQNRIVPGIADVAHLAVAATTACVLTRAHHVTCWGGHWLSGLFGTDRKNQPPTEIPELAGVDEIAVGAEHICGRRGGEVVCHGQNLYSLLGDPNVACCAVSTAKVRGLTDAVAIRAGFRYTCALRATGHVACWGERVGSRVTDEKPVEVPGLADVVELSTGFGHVCARHAKGVSCWGDDSFGQLGDGHSAKLPRPERVPIEDAVQLAVGYLHTCVRRANGSVWCWGPFENMQRPTQITVLGTATSISSGIYETCARGTDGSVHCVQRGRGEFPAGTLVLKGTPVQLRVGGGGICALLAGGKVACAEEIMDAHSLPGPLPVRAATELPFADATLIAVGPTSVCAAGREVSCAGYTDFRMRGANDPPWSTPSPIKNVAAADVTALGISSGGGCALLRSGHVTCWGLGEDAIELPALDDVVELAAGSSHTCVRRRDGTVWCWGRNEWGQVGDGKRRFDGRAEPVRVVGLEGALEIGAGDAHTCARTARGVFCWGANDGGRLGLGTLPYSDRPVAVAGLPR